MIITEAFPDLADFTELLSDAEEQARTEWEMEFVSDMIARYSKWTDKTIVSIKQIELLRRIARGNNEQH